MAMISNFFRSKGGAKVPAETTTAQMPAPPPASPAGDLPVIRGTSDPQLPAFVGVLTTEDGVVPVEADERRHVILLDAGDHQAILVWTNQPDGVQVMRQVVMEARAKGLRIIARFAASSDVIAVLYETGSKSQTPHVEAGSDIGEMDRRFRAIVSEAVRLNASDIHLYARKGHPTSVLFRINGELELHTQMPHEVAQDLSTAAFNFAGAEKSDVQFSANRFLDARIQRNVEVGEGGDKRSVLTNLRFASKPTLRGWDVVLRVLIEGDAGSYWPLWKLGYDGQQIAAFERMLSRPQGMTLICGTTGSGKSRTLQTLMALQHERDAGRKSIVTIEDPPEYHIPGASQVPVRRVGDGDSDADEEAFAIALRACMRADPDTIMVGEIRDRATGALAQQAVQSGHRVASTLHAPNPFDAIERLIDLGIERTVLAGGDFLAGIVYQRLLPVVCPDCAVSLADMPENTVNAAMLQRLNRRAKNASLGTIRFRGAGCDRCRHSGVIGRTVVAAMLEPDYDVLELMRLGERNRAYLYWRAGGDQRSGIDNGIIGRTALDNGIEKMFQGIVSPLDVEQELGWLDSEVSREQAIQRLQALASERHSGGSLDQRHGGGRA